MSQKLINQFREFIPPANLLPLLLAYMFDSLAISSYWIFFGIWLNEEVITPEAGYNFPYLTLTVILAIPPFISIIGNSFFSSFSDKTGMRKEIMFFARLLLMAQCLLLIFFGDSTWKILLILSICAVHTIFYIMHSALITTICHPDRRGEVSSFQMFFASLGWMIGSSVSGLIYSTWGMIGGLSFGAGFALLTGISALFSPTTPIEEGERNANQEDEIVEKPVQVSTVEPAVPKVPLADSHNGSRGYFQIMGISSVTILLLTLAVVDFGFGPFNAMASVYLKAVGLTENYIALSNTIATFLGMMFQVIIGKLLDSKGRRPIFLIAIVAYPILFLFTYLLSNFWIAVFILYSYPLYAFKIPAANAIMSDLTYENERARGMSLLQFEQTIFLNTGSFLGAYISDISKKGIFVLPLFPLGFGIIAFGIAFFFMRETNKRIISLTDIKDKEEN